MKLPQQLIQQVRRIATHARPHLDELAALWLVLRFGKLCFPGAAQASLHFWTSGAMAADWQPEPTDLLIGVGNSPYNEHPDLMAGRRRKRGECATTLIAQAMGIAGEPELAPILAYAADTDAAPERDTFGLASVVKDLNERFADDPRQVIDIVFKILDAKFYAQRQFHSCAAEFAKLQQEGKATVVETERGGRHLRIVAAQTGNPKFQSWARWPKGLGAAVVIQQQPSGNVQIVKQDRLVPVATMERIAVSLRLAEAEVAGIRHGPEVLFMVAQEGMWEDGRWFVFKAANGGGVEEVKMILNGSHSHPDVPPTLLPLAMILRIVEGALIG